MSVCVLSRCFLFAAFLCALLPRAHASIESAGELQQVYRDLVASYAGRVERPTPPATGELLFLAADHYLGEDNLAKENLGPHLAYAQALYELAQRATNAGQPSLAFQWATEVLAYDPNHSEARRVLGYELVENHWLTPYAAKMAKKNREWHPLYGWVVKEDIPRFELGERKQGSTWVSSETDALRHEKITNGWQIRTDRFLVTTNHSLEAGVELSARLESLYQAWRQLFAGFYMSDREVRKLFAGERNPRGQSKPFRVIYHRNKQEYVDALRRRQPRIAETLGIYFDQDREAHFFASDDPHATAVLHHEAVHQLFQESRRSARHVGQMSNFWVVEGVATYFESLVEKRDPELGAYFTIGEADAGRLPAARQRALEDKFYLPLAEFCRLGKTELQRHPDIAKLYSQAAGVATCLVHGEGGQYREPLVRYLVAVYGGKDHPRSLTQATGRSFAEIDATYRQFLRSLP